MTIQEEYEFPDENYQHDEEHRPPVSLAGAHLGHGTLPHLHRPAVHRRHPQWLHGDVHLGSVINILNTTAVTSIFSIFSYRQQKSSRWSE